MLNRIQALLSQCKDEYNKFPPAELYCEGWMQRLVLYWFASNPSVQHRPGLPNGSDWYSGARLPFTFFPGVA